MEQIEAAIVESLYELAKEEDALAIADENLGRAVGRHRIAAKRYAALIEGKEHRFFNGISRARVQNSHGPGLLRGIDA